ncbi:hypothetical protein J2848_000366 [Azospirillum lipoferum]|uniref:Uncharacterized protein n=1 Tax=Azospirillum lipoferum TaxID=193 RepID=A0A5A9GRZ1_AZOLI|nr:MULTISPECIES: hypothetical protein [Azospirillum]KAA0597218.1 hypothetical protein FZ942_09000 [Azospirillum lipoferum]MCP1608730.1 hypothetical protein [Azospirillum lipoferum]MDW5535952.1 hypothetical protein [Azospirillum sp. NL1]
MAVIDLDTEFDAAVSAVPPNDAGRIGEWLAARGLSARTRAWVGGVGISRATLSRVSRTFEPNPVGVSVLIAAAWVGQAGLSEIEDLVAWRPSDPGTLFLRRGDAIFVGADGVRQALVSASPLRIHRSVERFAAAGGDVYGEFPGAVIVAPAMAGWLHLRDMPALIVDDVEHGREVRDLLEASRPALPPILVSADADRRAA